MTDPQRDARRSRVAALSAACVVALVALVAALTEVPSATRSPEPSDPGVEAPTGTTDVAAVERPTTTNAAILDGRHHVDSVRGDDRNGDGSVQRPWRTLAHTMAKAGAARGAVTVVVFGSPSTPYREALGANGGTISRQMRIIAAPGAQPVISGADVFSVRNRPANGQAGPSWITQRGGIWEADYATPFPAPPADVNRDPTDTAGGCDELRRFCIYPDQVPIGSGAGALERVWIDGAPLRPVSSRDLVGLGTFFYDREQGRLVVGTDPTEASVETATRWRAAHVTPSAAGSSLEGLTFTQFSPFHAGGQATVVVTADRVRLRDLTLTRSGSTALYLGGDVGRDLLGVRLTNVIASQNGATGLTANRVRDLVIEDSSFDANNAAGFSAAGGPFNVMAGAKLVRCTDVTVTGSSFVDNRGTGIWFDLGCVNVTVRANAIERNTRHGIFFEVSRRARIEANSISGHGPDGVGLNLAGSDDVEIVANRFVANDRHLWAPVDPNTDRPEADRRYLVERGIDNEPSDIVIGANDTDAPLG